MNEKAQRTLQLGDPQTMASICLQFRTPRPLSTLQIQCMVHTYHDRHCSHTQKIVQKNWLTQIFVIGHVSPIKWLQKHKETGRFTL